ncbi:MAG: hypothetical protein U9Q07_05415 [Planctomycetota bacterium]|nr:hypothetical protein [Planctomycetota bacterium]
MSWLTNPGKYRRSRERKIKKFIKKYEVKAIIVSELEDYLDELSPKAKVLLVELFAEIKDAVSAEDIARNFINWLKGVAALIDDE